MRPRGNPTAPLMFVTIRELVINDEGMKTHLQFGN